MTRPFSHIRTVLDSMEEEANYLRRRSNERVRESYNLKGKAKNTYVQEARRLYDQSLAIDKYHHELISAIAAELKDKEHHE